MGTFYTDSLILDPALRRKAAIILFTAEKEILKNGTLLEHGRAAQTVF